MERRNKVQLMTKPDAINILIADGFTESDECSGGVYAKDGNLTISLIIPSNGQYYIHRQFENGVCVDGSDGKSIPDDFDDPALGYSA